MGHDWSDHFDDFDSCDWAEYMGGPDDDHIEYKYQSYVEQDYDDDSEYENYEEEEYEHHEEDEIDNETAMAIANWEGEWDDSQQDIELGYWDECLEIAEMIYDSRHSLIPTSRNTGYCYWEESIEIAEMIHESRNIPFIF